MLGRIRAALLIGVLSLAVSTSYANEEPNSRADIAANLHPRTTGDAIGDSVKATDDLQGGRLLMALQRPVTRLKNSQFTYRLPDLEGHPVDSTDSRFKNKVVLYDIWGTWCPPCREMTPFLKKLHEKYASKGLVIVGIAFEIDREDVVDPKTLVADYVTDHGIPYLTLYAGAAEHPSTLVFDKLSFTEFDGFPTAVVVNRDGKAVRIEEGFDERIAKRLESYLEDLLEAE